MFKKQSFSFSSIGHWEESCGNAVVPVQTFNNKGYSKKYQSVVESWQNCFYIAVKVLAYCVVLLLHHIL